MTSIRSLRAAGRRPPFTLFSASSGQASCDLANCALRAPRWGPGPAGGPRRRVSGPRVGRVRQRRWLRPPRAARAYAPPAPRPRPPRRPRSGRPRRDRCRPLSYRRPPVRRRRAVSKPKIPSSRSRRRSSSGRRAISQLAAGLSPTSTRTAVVAVRVTSLPAHSLRQVWRACASSSTYSPGGTGTVMCGPSPDRDNPAASARVLAPLRRHTDLRRLRDRLCTQRARPPSGPIGSWWGAPRRTVEVAGGAPPQTPCGGVHLTSGRAHPGVVPLRPPRDWMPWATPQHSCSSTEENYSPSAARPPSRTVRGRGRAA